MRLMRASLSTIWLALVKPNWLEKHGAYKSAYWHGVRYYFYEWLSETRSTAEAKRIMNSPEIGTVTEEYVGRMLG